MQKYFYKRKYDHNYGVTYYMLVFLSEHYVKVYKCRWAPFGNQFMAFFLTSLPIVVFIKFEQCLSLKIFKIINPKMTVYSTVKKIKK